MPREAGEFLDLREWLRREVHIHGKRYQAEELIAKVTGEQLSSQPFLDYLRSKFQ